MSSLNRLKPEQIRDRRILPEKQKSTYTAFYDSTVENDI